MKGLNYFFVDALTLHVDVASRSFAVFLIGVGPMCMSKEVGPRVCEGGMWLVCTDGAGIRPPFGDPRWLCTRLTEFSTVGLPKGNCPVARTVECITSCRSPALTTGTAG